MDLNYLDSLLIEVGTQAPIWVHVSGIYSNIVSRKI